MKENNKKEGNDMYDWDSKIKDSDHLTDEEQSEHHEYLLNFNSIV